MGTAVGDSSTPLIRVASAADARELARMHVASWHESYPGLVPAALLASISVEARAAAWSRILGEPSGATVVLVAELHDAIVAFGSCGPQRTQALQATYAGEVQGLYVLRAFQRRALGARLLGAMASRMQVRGFRGASLWVLRDNAPARRFYERCGGQVIGEREDVRPEGVLFEVVYGWPDLAQIAQLTAARSPV